MLLKIDFNDDTPIYRQLCNQIILGLARGQLKPGDPLPSVRQLAADIGINLHTVNKAYNLLKQDGFLTVSRKSGVVVSFSPFPNDEKFKEKLTGGLEALVAESVCRGVGKQEFSSLCEKIFDDFKGDN